LLDKRVIWLVPNMYRAFGEKKGKKILLLPVKTSWLVG
jgi:hypothetical protein